MHVCLKRPVYDSKDGYCVYYYKHTKITPCLSVSFLKIPSHNDSNCPKRERGGGRWNTGKDRQTDRASSDRDTTTMTGEI